MSIEFFCEKAILSALSKEIFIGSSQSKYGFADFYYDPDYLNAYTSFVENDLQKTVPGIGFSWEEYHQFQHIIDSAYKMYLKR